MQFEEEPGSIGEMEALSSEVTALLGRWRRGEAEALNALIPLVHGELRKLARRSLRGESEGQTLQPTALVNEAYLRMVDAAVAWQDRAHFFALVARMMRRIVIDHARARRRTKRGGEAERVTLSGREAGEGIALVDILDVDRALEKLREVDARKAEVLELHFFGGLKQDEMAEVLGVSPRTVFQDLKIGRAWMAAELKRVD